ncbi:class I SAM-dependent methyltransferase [Thermococcus sp. AM4]|uniref:class I SAM-dependent methyltransferase n=1 Tax=Thermococcus sp. (strain AM4) TaxID=246969 RepID=UPI00018707D3|nr:class I SAM-dependent methyltransferase [Thermococcus sp. AM4]EEB73756.1 Ubiquinone/menaquinone biosynthesis methyltransferase UbiE [Thermococcus sp. AM4]
MSFEKYYSTFKAYSDLYSEEYRRRIETLEPLLLKFMPKRGRVLDLACGVGGFSFLLEDHGFEVVGVDSSELMLERAREYAKEKRSRVQFVKADAQELPFENDSFDYVLFIGDSVVHFSPTELNRVFKEIRRVLRPGGRLIMHFLDLREFLPKLMDGQVIGEEYWISKVLPDKDGKTVVIEFQSEKDYFRVRFNVWGKTGVELLAKLYFRPIHSERIGEHSYFQVYEPRK